MSPIDRRKEEPSISTRATALAARLASLSHWTQRGVVFGELTEATPPEEASSLFSHVVGAPSRNERASLATVFHAAFLATRSLAWTEEHRTRTREAAAAVGDELTSVFLVDIEPPGAPPDDLDCPDYGAGRALTLGERRAIASNPDRAAIEGAMRDPHPMVAARLLSNPKLTENDVVRIAASRRQSAFVLHEVAAHMRWRTRRRVAFALVSNPILCCSMGLWLLPVLGVADLREAASDNRLEEPLRRGAAILASARTRR